MHRMGIPQKWDPGLRTPTSGLGHKSQKIINVKPRTWDPGPQIFKVGPGKEDL